MKKQLVLLISIVIINSFLHAEEFQFRGLDFSTLYSDVVKQEGEPDEKVDSSSANMMGDYYILYNKKQVAEYEAQMEIEFEDDVIIVGTYKFSFTQNRLNGGASDPRNYFNAYNSLVSKLQSKYGEPIISDVVETFERGTSEMYINQLIDMSPYNTIWEISDGAIMLKMNYSNKWDLYLIYISPRIYSQIKQRQNSTEGL